MSDNGSSYDTYCKKASVYIGMKLKRYCFMMAVLTTIFDQLSEINEVQSIGISGGKISFPKAGEGDIDVFIYCSEIPASELRQAVLTRIGGALQEFKYDVFSGGFWGVGDLMLLEGVEIWLMYFTERETTEHVESILRGEYPDRLDNYYYPIGRLAMLKDIHIIIDKDHYLSSMKQRLSIYPDFLAEKLVQHHIAALDDHEDLLRAVARKDVLFYHFALDIALDHFLQALFALNKTFFPSRKRSFLYIADFSAKPNLCEERIAETLNFGGNPEKLSNSYAIWSKLTYDLKKLFDNDF